MERNLFCAGLILNPTQLFMAYNVYRSYEAIVPSSVEINFCASSFGLAEAIPLP